MEPTSAEPLIKTRHSTTGPQKNKKRKMRTIIIIVAALIAIRIALPYVILHFANKTLAGIDGYYGHVEDIDLAIYRGAYKIKDMYLNKKDTVTNVQTDFFNTRVIDLSIHWSALFEGKIVGELELTDPVLRFTKDKVEPKEIQKDSTDFKKLLDDFMPLKINRFEIMNGLIQYVDNGSSPKVDIEMTNTHILAENLTTEKSETLLPSTVKASANLYDGTLDFNMKLDALADKPTFDMNAELKNTSLPELNEFFKAYGNFDINKGTMGMYTEVAARDNKFVGYVKPIIKDLDVVGKEDKNDALFNKFWERIIGGAGVILKNQKHDQVATKVPMEGTFTNASTNIWYAAIDVLRNAFIRALQPSIDHEINIGTVQEVEQEEEKKGFLGRIFNTKSDSKEKGTDSKINNAKKDKVSEQKKGDESQK